MSWYKAVSVKDIDVYTQMGMIKVCDKLLVKPGRDFQHKEYYFDDCCSNLYWLHDMMLEDGNLIYEVIETSNIYNRTQIVFEDDLHLCMWPVRVVQMGIKKALKRYKMQMKLTAMVTLKQYLPFDLILTCVNFI